MDQFEILVDLNANLSGIHGWAGHVLVFLGLGIETMPYESDVYHFGEMVNLTTWFDIVEWLQALGSSSGHAHLRFLQGLSLVG